MYGPAHGHDVIVTGPAGPKNTEQAVADHFLRSLDPRRQRSDDQTHKRSLPASYFQSPGHSREGSTSSSGLGSVPSCVSPGIGGSTFTQIAHHRVRSLPSSLPGTDLSGNPLPSQFGLNPHSQQSHPLQQQHYTTQLAVGQPTIDHQRSRSYENHDQTGNSLLAGGYTQDAGLSHNSFLDVKQEHQRAHSTGSLPRNASLFGATTQSEMAGSAPMGDLPEGWEMGYTNAGEVFFIDHRNRKTTWFDPRLPEHVQRERIIQKHALNNNTMIGALMQQGPGGAPPSAGGSFNISQRVQQLNEECMQLKQRQQDLKRQAVEAENKAIYRLYKAAYKGLLPPSGTPGSSPGHPVSPASSHGGDYPSPGINVFHGRTTSQDSGVGDYMMMSPGRGTNCSQDGLEQTLRELNMDPMDPMDHIDAMDHNPISPQILETIDPRIFSELDKYLAPSMNNFAGMGQQHSAAQHY